MKNIYLLTLLVIFSQTACYPNIDINSGIENTCESAYQLFDNGYNGYSIKNPTNDVWVAYHPSSSLTHLTTCNAEVIQGDEPGDDILIESGITVEFEFYSSCDDLSTPDIDESVQINIPLLSCGSNNDYPEMNEYYHAYFENDVSQTHPNVTYQTTYIKFLSVPGTFETQEYNIFFNEVGE